jgi:cytochrome c556
MPPVSLLSALAIALLLGATGSQAEGRPLERPPDSLAQWYKPANERQVWLHHMFRLRTELQAVTEYAQAGDAEGVRRWGEPLVEHYLQIGEMVPEWRAGLEDEAAGGLRTAIQGGDLDRVLSLARRIGQNCNSCHRDHQAVTAALLRSPDFSPLRLRDPAGGGSLDYPALMEQLSTQVNRIKIASRDQRQEQALEALAALEAGLGALGEGCASCHDDPAPRERILGAQTAAALAALGEAIRAGDAEQTGRHLGSAAVLSCARCHGVHRTLHDLRQAIGPAALE